MGFLEQLRALWLKLTINQKVFFLFAIAVAVALIAASVFWAQRPDYVILYSNLKTEDAGKIVDRLRTEKIPYELTDGGRTVLVPSRHVYDMRLNLATEGLPQSSSVGFEIFDHPKLGMTDFMQKLNYQRAMQGELVRTIEQMEEVQQARVHIVVPEQSLFTEQVRQPTASVVLKVSGKGTLNRAHVRGITHLVASSVDGLKPENVTVVDTFGNILAGGSSEDDVTGASSDQLFAQQSVEKYLRKKAQSMLESVLGPGKAIVQVHALLDFQKVNETIERYDDANPVIRSEETIRSTGAEGEASQENTVTNYEISRSLKQVIETSGNIEKLTIAVLVDGKYETGEDGAAQYVSRSNQELDQLAELVKGAVGYDLERGDKIEIANIAFDTVGLEEQRREMDRANRFTYITQIGSKVGMAALILGLLLIVRMFFKRATDVVAVGGRVEGGRMPELDMKQRAANQLEDQLSVLANEKPLDVARLVRTWLKEE
jgi:flagellar M-ring protein FliF